MNLKNGGVFVNENRIPSELIGEIKTNRRVFAIVNPYKYNGHPEFTNRVSDFNDLQPDERAKVIENWNWLGHESKANFDFNGDDFFGFDLNRKLSLVHIDKEEK